MWVFQDRMTRRPVTAGTDTQQNSGEVHRCGFKVHQKLRRRAQFDRVYRTGRRVSGRHLTLVATGNDLGYCRLGMAVSRKVDRAVGRNRIRRLIREAFRVRQFDLPAGYDVIVTPRRGWVEPPFEKLCDELVDLVRRAVQEGPNR